MTNQIIYGEIWDRGFCNAEDDASSYAYEGELCGTKRALKYASEIREALELPDTDVDKWQIINDAICQIEDALTSYARKMTGHQWVYFGTPECTSMKGYWFDIDSFLEDCDLKVDDLGKVPDGFSGFVAVISDHGNISAYEFIGGKGRLLASVV